MGENYDFCGIPECSYFLEDIDSTSSGYTDIQNRYIRADFFKVSEGIGNIKGQADDFRPFDLRQDLGQSGAHQFRVFSNEKAKVVQLLFPIQGGIVKLSFAVTCKLLERKNKSKLGGV